MPCSRKSLVICRALTLAHGCDPIETESANQVLARAVEVILEQRAEILRLRHDSEVLNRLLADFAGP